MKENQNLFRDLQEDFRKMKKNLLVAQSGGPTAAINATLAGVIKQAIKEEQIDQVYGACYGIQGVLEQKFVNLTEKVDTEEKLEKLKRTPAAALGSCRFKLNDIKEDDSQYQEIVDILHKMNIGYFVYIGGNDSMDTVAKLSAYCKEKGVEDIKVIGGPKTIDNDLCGIDHCPGFGSAAKYISTVFCELEQEITVYEPKNVIIVEMMGRHAGWLTAASVLARKFDGDNPVLIYLPEVAFDPDAFIEKVKASLEHTSNLVVCISEGINDGNGTFVCELASDVGVDTFGHKMLTGSGKYLENLVKDRIGVKVRSIELNVCQRCSSSMLSKTDQKEAIASGAYGVKCAVEGATGKMIAFRRSQLASGDYCIDYVMEDVNLICNQEKTVPLEWISKDGSDIKDDFIRYAAPLILGEVTVPTEEGLPKFAYRK